MPADPDIGPVLSEAIASRYEKKATLIVNSPLPILTTLRVVADAWQAAEESVRDRIGRIHVGAGEEFITELMHGLFAEQLGELNSRKRIEQAFFRDLEKGCADIPAELLQRIAKGLVAQSSLHPRDVERHTGGDLGLVISRPRVSRLWDRLKVERQYRRGLLCQAKLKRLNRSWDRFTDTQDRVLPAHIAHLALLLYRYLDVEQQELAEFRWQVCAGVKFQEVSDWLARDCFPTLVGSRSIITELGRGTIGTDSESIIDDVIAPSKCRVLTIRIDWPNGGPGPDVRVTVNRQVQVPERQTIRVLS